jgi:hypothetical protein
MSFVLRFLIKVIVIKCLFKDNKYVNSLPYFLYQIRPHGMTDDFENFYIFEFVKHLSNNHMIARRTDDSIFWHLQDKRECGISRKNTLSDIQKTNNIVFNLIQQDK